MARSINNRSSSTPKGGQINEFKYTIDKGSSSTSNDGQIIIDFLVQHHTVARKSGLEDLVQHFKWLDQLDLGL